MKVDVKSVNVRTGRAFIQVGVDGAVDGNEGGIEGDTELAFDTGAAGYGGGDCTATLASVNEYPLDMSFLNEFIARDRKLSRLVGGVDIVAGARMNSDIEDDDFLGLGIDFDLDKSAADEAEASAAIDGGSGDGGRRASVGITGGVGGYE